MQEFQELRILDLSTEIAGPYAAKLFGDAGATVIKIEDPTGDPLRRWSPSGIPPREGSDSALFQFLAGGTKSVALDLHQPVDRAEFLELASGADLVFESFGPGGMEERGLDFPTLHRTNAKLSLISVSPWGLKGPWAKRPATEWTLQAATGMMARRGLPDRGPVGVGGRIAEWVAGAYASFGALASWQAARESGHGQHVDVSMFEALLQCGMPYNDLGGQFTGRPLRQYVDTPSLEPARDGWVGFATVTAQQWQDFCALIEQPEVAEDTRFHHTDNRMDALSVIQDMIHAWTKRHSVEEIIERACAMRIPVAPMGNGQTLPKIDQFAQRGVFQSHPGGFLQPRTPYKIGNTPPPLPRPAPHIGDHRAQDVAPPTTQNARSRKTTGPGLPFDGLRVLDLTAFWAGPFLTGHLAMLGADVVKIESTQRPDGMRFVNAIKGDRFWEASSIYHGANPNKRGLTLALDREEGRSIFLELAKKADVVVENFSARVLPNLRLDPTELHTQNPELIVVRMPSWGLDGPWRDRVGFAMNVEQACGLAWRSGYEDLPMIVNICDPVGALHAFFALNIALERRRRTGRGEVVEVPLVEPGLNIAAEQVIEYSAYGRLLTRTGNRGPAAAPQGVYRCRDEAFLSLALTSDRQWQELARELGNPEWTRDKALAREAGRRADHDRIDRELTTFFAKQSVEEISQRLRDRGIAAEPLVNAHQVMPNPQLEYRRFYQEMEHEVVGRRRYPTLPMRFSTFAPSWMRSPPPTLGQHNEEILRGELDLSPEDLDQLRREKVIGDRPAWR